MAFIIAVATLATAACSEEQGSDPRPDAGPQPQFSMFVYSPRHLQSQVLADEPVEIDVKGTSRPDNAFPVVQKVVSLYARTTKAAIPGKWSWTGTSGPTYEFTYQPTSPLADGDYVVAVAPPADVKLYEPSKVLFHVGSMPRVREVRLQTDTANTVVTKIGVKMSEPVNTAQAAVTVEQETKAGWTKLSTQLKSAAVTSTILLYLSSPVALNEKLRITVPANVGAVSSKLLDGKYSGQPGSGPLVVELVPSTLLTDNGIVWTPSLQL